MSCASLARSVGRGIERKVMAVLNPGLRDYMKILLTSEDPRKILDARDKLLASDSSLAPREVERCRRNRLRSILEKEIEKIGVPVRVMDHLTAQGSSYEETMSSKELAEAAQEVGLTADQVRGRLQDVEALIGWHFMGNRAHNDGTIHVISFGNHATYINIQSSLLSALDVNFPPGELIHLVENLLDRSTGSRTIILFDALPTAIRVIQDTDKILLLFKYIDEKLTDYGNPPETITGRIFWHLLVMLEAARIGNLPRDQIVDVIIRTIEATEKGKGLYMRTSEAYRNLLKILGVDWNQIHLPSCSW